MPCRLPRATVCWSKTVASRPPALCAIIALKLGKALLLLFLALGAWKLSDQNLPGLFRHLLLILHLDPEKQFFVDLGLKLGQISSQKLQWMAAGTGLYGLCSLTEGVGLLLRAQWAGWLAIAESCFFIPIEVYELLHRASIAVGLILLINVWIVVYLWVNRERLFRR
ncbi:MAG: DUF2127 domain-containing protein [Verrucomicrobiota bacterium]|nr:DUF2127 domain-containing protein [Limisphaera sp.]MDW8382730.1 DUF2127 domain-containing protein [Verrucomicrobiota bacterium]